MVWPGGETTRVCGAKRLGLKIEAKRLGGKRPGGKRLGAKRLVTGSLGHVGLSQLGRANSACLT